MVNEENDNFSAGADDEQVSRLLSGLNRVQAPADFEFRVRAGIASRNADGRRSWWIPITAGLAAPLVLAVAGAAYFGFIPLPGQQTAEVPLVAEAGPMPFAPAADPSSASQPGAALPAAPIVENDEPRPVNANDRVIAAEMPRRSVNTNRTVTVTGGGSFDEALSEGKKLFPRGISPGRELPANVVAPDGEGQIRARDILTMMGISASFTAAGCTVSSVAASNLAGRAGIKAGDVIEAINGQPVSENTSFGNKFTGKSLRVRRDGKVIEIGLGR
jgi:membrane-associated protease RseP (regulator of RpoE activity)